MSPTRPMTEEEIFVLKLLAQVKFPFRTMDYRFGNNIVSRLHYKNPMISKREVHAFWRLLWRYRTQIKHPQRAYYFRKATKLMLPGFKTTLEKRIHKLEAALKLAQAEKALLDAQWLPQGKTLCEVFAEEEQKS